jgi:hypothetical protein
MNVTLGGNGVGGGVVGVAVNGIMHNFQPFLTTLKSDVHPMFVVAIISVGWPIRHLLPLNCTPFILNLSK